MKEELNFLIDYIEGDKSSFSEEELLILANHKTSGVQSVYRGLSFETKEEFLSKFPDCDLDLKTFTYKSETPQSFSTSLDQAEYFAQDIYSNFGVVFKIDLENYLDLNAIAPDDFSHEQEILSVNPIQEKVKILKIFSNTKEKLGLKD